MPLEVRVLVPVGGNGAILGGAHNIVSQSLHMSDVQSDMLKLVVCRLFDQTSDVRLSRFFSFCWRWIVYSWRRSAVTDGECKDNTSKEPFSQCESLQGIRVQVRNWIDWYNDTNWIGDTKCRVKNATLWSDLKHFGNMWVQLMPMH